MRELGGYLCGRRLYETMLVWETDPSLRCNVALDTYTKDPLNHPEFIRTIKPRFHVWTFGPIALLDGWTEVDVLPETPAPPTGIPTVECMGKP